MKNYPHKNILILLFILALLSGCKKKNFNEEGIVSNNTTHTITSVTPVAAQYGNTVTIKGTKFGTIASILSVKINNASLTFALVDSNTITVNIPKGLGSGAVSVTKNTTSVTGPNFEYLFTGNVSTFSGNGDDQPLTGTALAVGYDQPYGLTLDAQNNLYVGEARGLRRIDANGNVTNFNVTQFGNGTGAVGDIANIGSNIYFTAPQTHTIFSFNTATGGVSHEAGNFSAGYLDGTAMFDVKFNGPFGIAKNAANELLIVDAKNNCIRRLIPQSNLSTFAGQLTAGDVNANGTSARFNQPFGISIDASNEILIADYGNSKIKKIAANKDVTKVAGTTLGYENGPLATAKFINPTHAVKDNEGNIVVSDWNNTIRCISPGGIVYTLAGTNSAGAFADGSGAAAWFNGPVKILFAGSKTFYISDANNRRIRKMILE